MPIQLTPEQEVYVNRKLQTGSYSSAASVVEEAFRALEIQNDRASELQEIRKKILTGIEQANRGEFSSMTFEDIKAEGRRRIQP